MKKVFLFICVTLGLMQFQSCKPKDGEPGPAGESSLYKLGSFSGTFHYKLANGDTAIVPYNFEYYDSEKNNAYLLDTANDSYSFNINRQTLKDTRNNFYMFYNNGLLDANNLPEVPSDMVDFDIDFQLNTKVNNKLLYFSSYSFDNVNSTISNYSFNSNTGALSFDYVIIIPSYYIGNSIGGINDGITSAKLIGKFTSTLASDENLESGYGNSIK